MAESSPFSSLGRDKALLRSTKQEAQIAVETDQQNSHPPLPDPTASKATPRRQAKPKSAKAVDETPSDLPSDSETKISKYQDINIDTIRKVVRIPGKEAAVLRLTSVEKDAHADVVYGMKKHGIKTSETQIIRIAINALIEEHRINGENSVLTRTLKALNE